MHKLFVYLLFLVFTPSLLANATLAAAEIPAEKGHETTRQNAIASSSQWDIDLNSLKQMADHQLDKHVQLELAKRWQDKAKNSRSLKIACLGATAGLTLWGLEHAAHGATALVEQAMTPVGETVTSLERAHTLIETATLEGAHVAEVAFGSTCAATNHRSWNMFFEAIKRRRAQIQLGVVATVATGLFLGTILWTGPTATIILSTGKIILVSAKLAALIYATYRYGDKTAFKNFYLHSADQTHLTFTDDVDYSLVKIDLERAFTNAQDEDQAGQELSKLLENDLKITLEQSSPHKHELANAIRTATKNLRNQTLKQKEIAAQRLASAESLEYLAQMQAIATRLAARKAAFDSAKASFEASRPRKIGWKIWQRFYRTPPQLKQLAKEVELLQKQQAVFEKLKPKTTLSGLLANCMGEGRFSEEKCPSPTPPSLKRL